MARKDPPLSVKQQVLAEAAYRCGNPRCNNVITLQLHHIHWVKDSGGNDSSNLLPLCGYCHDMHTQGHIPAEAIRMWKGLLLALNHAFDRQSMDLLLFLQKQPSLMRHSADGVLQFARLVAVNLAVVHHRVPAGYSEGLSTYYEVELTERGKLLLEAWQQGDEEAYHRMLAESRTQERP